MGKTIAKFFYRGIRTLIRSSMVALFLAVFTVGVLTIYECAVGDNYYPREHLQILKPPLRQLAFKNSTSKPNQRTWEGLKITLQIVKEIDPVVYDWVEECHKSNRFIISSESNGNLGLYKDGARTVTVYPQFFSVCSDGEKAAILAHEYRHSRQSFVKTVRCAIAKLLGNDNCDDIREIDACAYENEFKQAMLGNLF